MPTPILQLKGINKSFGPVHVLHDVDFDVYPGEVTALVGDNGAGKTTMVKCIGGIYSHRFRRIPLRRQADVDPRPRATRPNSGSRSCTRT